MKCVKEGKREKNRIEYRSAKDKIGEEKDRKEYRGEKDRRRQMREKNQRRERARRRKRELSIRLELLAFRPDLSSPFLSPPTLLKQPLTALPPGPHVPMPPSSPTMAQPPTYPAHRPTIPHSNTPTDRSIPTNYQAAPRLSFYPTTLNGLEN